MSGNDKLSPVNQEDENHGEEHDDNIDEENQDQEDDLENSEAGSSSQKQHSNTSYPRTQDATSSNCSITSSSRSKASNNSRTISLISCSLCKEICRRAVVLDCCGMNSLSCRSCAVKKITADRSCWICGRQDVSLDKDVINCQQLREACEEFRDRGKLSDDIMEELELLKQMNGMVSGSNFKNLERLEGKDKATCRDLLEKEREKQKKWAEIEKEEEKQREEEKRKRREEREQEEEKKKRGKKNSLT